MPSVHVFWLCLAVLVACAHGLKTPCKDYEAADVSPAAVKCVTKQRIRGFCHKATELVPTCASNGKEDCYFHNKRHLLCYEGFKEVSCKRCMIVNTTESAPPLQRGAAKKQKRKGKRKSK